MNLLAFMATMALIPYAAAGLILLLFFILFVVMGINFLYRRFKEWKATGFCRHEFELERTNSFGSKAWYKCKHCKTERLQ